MSCGQHKSTALYKKANSQRAKRERNFTSKLIAAAAGYLHPLLCPQNLTNTVTLRIAAILQIGIVLIFRQLTLQLPTFGKL